MTPTSRQATRVFVLFWWLGPCSLWLMAGTGKEEAAKEGLTLLKVVEATLSKNPSIAIEKQQVEIQKGRLQVQQGSFDTLLQSSVDINHTETPLKQAQSTNGDSRTSDSQSYSVGATKLLRSGLTLNPFVQTTRLDSGFSGDTIESRTDLIFNVAYPLLNGKGSAVTAAGEMAARTDLEAAFHNLNHTISSSILTSGSLYWSYLASFRVLEILKESEARAKKLVQDVQTIIDADEMPANEILQLKANLADKRSNRIGAELNLKQNREALGIALGLDPVDIRSLPLPSDAFPKSDGINIDQISRFQPYIDYALDRRGDLLANYLNLKSSDILLAASRNRLKPNLDLVFSAGYKGLEEGTQIDDFFTSIYQNIPGPTASISLSYQFPLKNHSAKGQFAQNHAIRDRTDIITQDLKRQISSNVLLALENVRHSMLSLQEAQIATSTYQLAVTNEIKKLQLGFSTLLDVISSEDRLRNAKLNQIGLERQFGVSLLEIRFQIGSLINLQSSNHRLTHHDLTTFPELENY